MLLLAFHIISISVLVVFTAALAYSLGLREGERRLQRRLEREQEQMAESVPAGPAASSR